MGKRAPITAALVAGIAIAAGCGGDADEAAEPSREAAAPAGQLAGVKDYLLTHTSLLRRFTTEFRADADRYHSLADAAGFDYEELWSSQPDEVGRLLRRLKATWVEGNPIYEQVEGVVAGTPSLSEYDVILDAGSSAAEDPQSAVPFDLTLPDGTVLEQPGNLYNLTEGALWGTLPDGLPQSAAADLDGDGTVEFGEALPDAGLLKSAAAAFERYAAELDRASRAWRPTAADAFTALVVMVPTMSEYFGQWKQSRFVAGETAEAFNVVSRLSDINDILAGLEVIYDGVQPRIARADAAQAEQTERELDDLRAFIGDLYQREQAGERFTPEQAEVLGTGAQERGTAIAGQVSQAAATLGVEIAQ